MDGEILESLYRKYYGMAFTYCVAICGQDQLAQDLVADAFVKAYLTLPDNPSSFQFWLLRVCRNLWIDHLRKTKHEASEEAFQVLSDSCTPEILFIREERSRVLWRIIQSLDQRDRELIVLHYFSGISLKEVAKVTNKSYASVRQRIVRLRYYIKNQMEEQGYGL